MLVEECVRRATEDKLRKKLLVMTCDWMTGIPSSHLSYLTPISTQRRCNCIWKRDSVECHISIRWWHHNW